jgi:hypothetical protein
MQASGVRPAGDGRRSARYFYDRRGFYAVRFTDGANNEEKMPDARYRWVRT